MKLAKILIQANVEAQLNKEYASVICLAGDPACGKTDAARQEAKRRGMSVVQINMATMQLASVSGLPSEITHNGSLVAVWSTPELIHLANVAAEENPNGVILILDDFHSIQGDSFNLFLQLLLERTIGEHRLHDNVAMMATMNQSEEAGFEGFSSAIRSRLQILEVELDQEDWFSRYGSKLEPTVSAFVQAHPEVLSEPESTGIEGSGSTRAMSFLSSQIKYLDKNTVESNATRIAKQFVSDEMALTFSSFVNVFHKLDLESKVKARVEINCDELSTLDSMLYSYVASYIKTEADGKWFIEQLNRNMKHSSFIGLSMGIAYSQYSTSDMTDGISFVIDQLLDKNSKLFDDRHNVMKIIGSYII